MDRQPAFDSPSGVRTAPRGAPADVRSPHDPISAPGFIGIMLLSLIPVVGFILLVVWALGGCRKLAKRSYARAALAVGALLSVLALFAGFVVAAWLESFLAQSGLDAITSLLLGG